MQLENAFEHGSLRYLVLSNVIPLGDDTDESIPKSISFIHTANDALL